MKRSSTNAAASRGVATLMVIVIIGLLGVVLIAITRRATADGVRATIEADEIQASRLLAAAKEIARGQLAAAPVDGPVPTPAGQVTLTWENDGPARTCVAVVQTGHVRREISLTFAGTRVTKAE